MTLVKKRDFDLDGVKRGALTVRDRIRGGSSPADEAKSSAKDASRKAQDASRKARTMANETRQTARKARAAAKDTRKIARKQYVRARVAAARATAPRRGGTSKKTVAGAGVAGAAGAYFLDPNEGKRRRHIVRDRAKALFRKGSERAHRETEYRKSQAEGKVEALKSKTRPEKPAFNDQDLADRVKSEIFRPADAPKGSVNVNVERGIVYLRGEVERPDEIKKLVKQAGSIDGVKGVESLLHT
jgi:osmotically-inducible protein OsmY